MNAAFASLLFSLHFPYLTLEGSVVPEQLGERLKTIYLVLACTAKSRQRSLKGFTRMSLSGRRRWLRIQRGFTVVFKH